MEPPAAHPPVRTRIKSIALRWAVASTLALGAFWLTWYFVMNQVPMTTYVRQWPRWWDITLGPIWSFIFGLTLESGRATSDGCKKEMSNGGLIGAIIAVISIIFVSQLQVETKMVAVIAICLAAILTERTIGVKQLVAVKENQFGWIIGLVLGGCAVTSIAFGLPVGIPLAVLAVALTAVYCHWHWLVPGA